MPLSLHAAEPGDLLPVPHLPMFALAPKGAAILQEQQNLRGWLARIEAPPSLKATTWDKLLERVAARRLKRGTRQC